MITWIADNIGTICVVAVLLAVIVLVSAKMIKDLKKGKSSCGCNCGHCAMSGQCHNNLDSDKK